MTANPLLGVLLHAIGGLASASFYLPYRKVRHWAWESYWLAGGMFSWIIAPWVMASLVVPDVLQVLHEAPLQSVFWSYFFGALWGIGGLTFGLTMRYLGLALGNAMALGYCATFGTLMPPIFKGEFDRVITSAAGKVILAGVAVCLLGIAMSGLAGISKERELPERAKKETIREFNFMKGVWVAAFCGIMSACMSYGFAAGKPIAAVAVQRGTSALWQNLPVLIVILAGGFTTNFVWCLILNLRHRTWGDYFNNGPAAAARTAGDPKVPVLANYFFCALAGATWYFQFFFYSMGTVNMGKYDFSSWTLHMASIMIFGTLWGAYLHEWRGVSQRTLRLRTVGLVVLVASTIVVGYGNHLGTLNQPTGSSAHTGASSDKLQFGQMEPSQE